MHRRYWERVNARDPADVRRLRDLYDGLIRLMDDQLAAFLERYRALGLERDTLFVFLSDHGEEFLDHGRHWHGMNAYGENTNVPLIMWGPGRVPAGIKIDTVVQSLDVLPTVLDLAGLDIPDTAQGQSMAPLMQAAEGGGSAIELGWENRPAISERYIHSSMGPGLGDQFNFYSMLSNEWKLVRKMTIEGETVGHELYDHAADPLDQNDVAAEHPEVVEKMVAQLDSWLAWAEENRLVSDADAAAGMSSEELERLRSLGYIQ